MSNHKSVQEIMNALYNGGVSSVEEILNLVYGGGNNRVIQAGPGCRYQSIQDAVDAAVAAGADADNQAEIIPIGPVALEYDDILPVGVSVRMDEAALESVDVPYRAPLIAVIADDCSVDWSTVSGDLAGVTPLAYAANNGIPVSLGLIGEDYAGAVPVTRIPLATIREYLRKGALHLFAHTYYHDDPATHAIREADTLGVKQIIHGLRDTAYGTAGHANQYLGCTCDVWKQAGTYTGDNYTDTYDKTQADMARTVRKHFGASMAYWGVASRLVRHMGMRTFETKAAAIAAIAGTPNRDMIVFTHGFGTYAATDYTAAEFKTLIDRLVALRAAGLAYPVTLRTWFAARHSSPYDASATTWAAKWRNLALVNGDLDTMATGAIPSTYPIDTWYSQSVQAPTVVDTGAGVNALQIDNDAAATTLAAHELSRCERGKEYMITLLARRIPDGGAGKQFRIIINNAYLDPAGELTNDQTTLGTFTLADSDDWTRYFVCTSIPTWAHKPTLWVASPSSAATKLQFRDVFVGRV